MFLVLHIAPILKFGANTLNCWLCRKLNCKFTSPLSLHFTHILEFPVPLKKFVNVYAALLRRTLNVGSTMNT
jgi:hypothetical protein